ncbi:MAG: ribonuclease [Sphingobacteriaceae bacterium]|nr:ribonuclease [Sphingobacteriaceae bacterium]
MAKRTSVGKKEQKIFVLDTSVILHDHNAINNFHEHDVAIPITVLEELDQFKKGNDSLNFEAREFIRFLDKMSADHSLQDWLSLNSIEGGRFRVEMREDASLDAQKIFGERKADHRILNSALHLKENNLDKKVVLVTKDVNLRLKAKALDLAAEDYRFGKVKNLDDIYTGKSVVSGIASEIIDRFYQDGFCLPEDVGLVDPVPNQYFILRNGKDSVMAFYNAFDGRLEKVEKRLAYGIKPRNAEQAFALHAVMSEQVRLVTLQGIAGTGKTLLALAGALEQRRFYKQLYLARPIVPLSNKDIGYLPGDIKSKLNPYMEPLWDNLKFIQHQFNESDKDYQKINELVQQEKLTITPLAYIRGRSFSNICFIVDEAQNLTPHEVKTIITRAGEGTKIIFTGDINQIDTPYLDAQSNGLTYLIERLKGQSLFAHITLEKGERSELANLANELL